MNNTSRMRWRPAVGVLVLGGLAIGLTIQSVSAERSRTTQREKAVKALPKLAPAAELTPDGARPFEMGAPTVAATAADEKSSSVVTPAPSAAPALSPVAAKMHERVSADVIRLELEEAGGLPKFVPDGMSAAPIGEAIPVGAFNPADIAAGTGACCTACPNAVCQDNVSEAACTGAGGVWRGKSTTCAAQAAACICRACCGPNGAQVPGGNVDVRIDDCDDPNTFHPFASWQATNNFPPPVCNPYDVNTPDWDNGAPLVRDGGAQRSHIFAANGGTGYSFVTADDIVVRGPDTVKVSYDEVEAWFMLRPAQPEIPDPNIDVTAYLITVFADRPAPDGTGLTNIPPPGEAFPSPAGFLRTPRTREDCTAPADDNDGDADVVVVPQCDIAYSHFRQPGGVIYSRIVERDGASPVVTHDAYCDLFDCTTDPRCDPPDTGANFESNDYWRVKVSGINPPILLNKDTAGRRYWFSIQGAFPFADGLRSTLQTWMALSENATGQRGKTFRSQTLATWGGEQLCNVDADCPNGQPGYFQMACVGSPLRCRRVLGQPSGGPCTTNAQCTPLLSGATCISGTCYHLTRVPAWIDNTGNRQDVGCPNAPAANTRRDYSFKLSGSKTPNVPNDTCQTRVEVSDGVTAYTTAGATSHGGAASCGAMPDDVYFNYTATKTGIITVSTGNPAHRIVIYDGVSCAGGGGPGGSLPELDDLVPFGTAACGLGSVTERVIQTGQYLIRVGGAQGKGNLAITVEDPCYFASNLSAPSCCAAPECGGMLPPCTVSGEECSVYGFCARPCIKNSDCLPAEPYCSLTDGYCHAGQFGCKAPAQSENCCRTVCGDDPVCCGALGGFYDFFCVEQARGEPACACACALDVSGADVLENETCDNGTTRINEACSAAGGPDLNLVSNMACGQTFFGKAWANGSTRDVDYIKFNVTDANSDGKALVNLVVRSQAPIAVTVIDASQCETECDLTNKCPTGNLNGTYVCDSNVDGHCGIVGYDTLYAAGCGAVSLDVTVDVPTGGNKDYWLLVRTVDSLPDSPDDCDDNRQLVGKFNGVACGTQNDYLITVGCDDDGPYPQGGCCLCPGGCVNTDFVDCVNQASGFGTWTGGSDNETCGTAPCSCYQHGCSDADVINLVDMGGGNYAATVAAQPLDTRPPTEPLPCATGAPNDSHWFVVTIPAGIDSVAMKTCDSVGTGRDSVLAAYCGSCCSTDLQERLISPGEDACSDDDCGFTGFNSRFCLQNLTNADGGADEFDGCRNMDGSVTLYVQVSNWGEPVEGLYELDVNAPCLGSCCDTNTGVCNDDVGVLSCQGASQRHNAVLACADLPLPCGRGACCQANGTCADVTGGNNCSGGNFYIDAVCDTPTTIGFVCNPADTCDYDHTPDSSVGLASQIFPDLNIHFQVADNILFKGSTDNDCLIEKLEVQTFHFNHNAANGCLMDGGANCADRPSDYQGVVVMIASDIDGAGPMKRPICAPTLPVTGSPPFFTPLGDDCQEIVYGAGSDEPLDPGVHGWYWQATCGGVGQCRMDITMQFNPPLQLQKNKKYWMGWAPILPLTGKFQVAWLATQNYDGNPPRQFISSGAQMWNAVTLDPPGDIFFRMTGRKQVFGCGPCRAYMDFESFFCFVDVGDVLKVLEAVANPDGCAVSGTTGLFVGAQIFEGGCPVSCTTAMDCPATAFGPAVCVAGQCCGGTDVSEVLQVLDMVQDLNTPTCPHPCPPGACELPNPANCCRDGGYFDANIANQGTSQSDCLTLDGTWLGDNTTCAGSSGLSICNTP